MWKNIYKKGEANAEKSLLGCAIAYLIMAVVVAAAMYVAGMQFRWFE